jgi:hypothetical protein
MTISSSSFQISTPALIRRRLSSRCTPHKSVVKFVANSTSALRSLDCNKAATMAAADSGLSLTSEGNPGNSIDVTRQTRDCRGSDGRDDGMVVGWSEGSDVGIVGCAVGSPEGWAVGCPVGSPVG